MVRQAPLSTEIARASPRSIEQERLDCSESQRMAAALVHNLNNALTGIIGNLELSLREVTSEHPIRLRLRAGLACAHKAAETIRRVATYAFRPRTPFPVNQLSLRQIAEWAVKRTGQQSDSETLSGSTRFEVNAESAGWVAANAQMLIEILDQLLANAQEALPEGGTIRLCVWESAEECHLSVSDTGLGFSPETLEHLFEPFATTKATGHLGLGLALCRQLIRAQGGEIDISEQLGQGTAVTLTLPTAQPLDLRLNVKKPEWQQQPAHLPKAPVALLPHASEVDIGSGGK
jgi:signal transduction histidine kinase